MWLVAQVLQQKKTHTRPSWVRRMESLLMSLWITPCLWRTDKAFRTDRHTVAICSSFILKTDGDKTNTWVIAFHHLNIWTVVLLFFFRWCIGPKSYNSTGHGITWLQCPLMEEISVGMMTEDNLKSNGQTVRNMKGVFIKIYILNDT